MTVRAATPEDAAAVAHVQVTSYQTAYAPHFPAGYWDGVTEEEQTLDWQAWLDGHPDDVWLVATDAGAVVGYGLARVGAYHGVDGEVMALHVLPEQGNRGHGRRLLATAVHLLIGSGCRSIGLSTLVDNPVRRWYESLGGARVATLVAAAGDGWTVREVVYTWADAAELMARLDERSSGRTSNG